MPRGKNNNLFQFNNYIQNARINLCINDKYLLIYLTNILRDIFYVKNEGKTQYYIYPFDFLFMIIIMRKPRRSASVLLHS